MRQLHKLPLEYSVRVAIQQYINRLRLLAAPMLLSICLLVLAVLLTSLTDGVWPEILLIVIVQAFICLSLYLIFLHKLASKFTLDAAPKQFQDGSDFKDTEYVDLKQSQGGSDFLNSEFESILIEAIERIEASENLDDVIASYPRQYRDELMDILFVVDSVQQIGVEPSPITILNSEFESILIEAIERIEASENLDDVIASYPRQYRDELMDILFVVDSVQQIGVEPGPIPMLANRKTAAKQDFLAAAQESTSEKVYAQKEEVIGSLGIFAGLLGVYLDRRGVSGIEIPNAFHVTPAAVNHWRSGRKLPHNLALLEGIADELDLDRNEVDALLTALRINFLLIKIPSFRNNVFNIEQTRLSDTINSLKDPVQSIFRSTEGENITTEKVPLRY